MRLLHRQADQIVILGIDSRGAAGADLARQFARVDLDLLLAALDRQTDAEAFGVDQVRFRRQADQMHRMAAKQHFGSEQRAIGRAHDQNFVSRRHCGLPYVLFVKSEIVPTLTGHSSRGRMLLGRLWSMQSGRTTHGRPAPAVTACRMPGADLLILGLVAVEQSAKRHLRDGPLGAGSLGSAGTTAGFFIRRFLFCSCPCLSRGFFRYFFSCALERRASLAWPFSISLSCASLP